MESFANLGGKTLHWKVDLDAGIIPSKAERHYVLFDGDVPVVTAQAIWVRQGYFDMVMECGEGTYQAHLAFDTPSPRPAVAWKLGEQTSLAGFIETSEMGTFIYGFIDTASGRRLSMDIANPLLFEYKVSAPDGTRLFNIGTPGRLTVSPAAAADPELPALVVLTFALGCAQGMELGKHMVNQ